MFGWVLLKCGVPKSVRFGIGDLPMYTFVIPTHPRLPVEAMDVQFEINLFPVLRNGCLIFPKENKE